MIASLAYNWHNCVIVVIGALGHAQEKKTYLAIHDVCERNQRTRETESGRKRVYSISSFVHFIIIILSLFSIKTI